VAPRESTAGEIEGGHLICFLGVVGPVEDPESLDLARDREVLERGLEGSAVEWLRAPSVRRSPEPVEGAEEDARWALMAFAADSRLHALCSMLLCTREVGLCLLTGSDKRPT